MVDYRYRAVVPVYDAATGRVAFCVDVYGVTRRDLMLIGEGAIMSRPIHKAIARMGFDPNRYKPSLFDIREG